MTVDLKTPVLLLVFNRPELTRKVFETIRRAAPAQLFIAADGPRSTHKDDLEKCREVKRIVEAVDWPCEVQTLYRTKNLGCRVAVSNAISWFFEKVPAGIILEDDCVPSTSFFHYCQELLVRYQDDTRVAHINGNNFGSPDVLQTGYSYHFTYFPQVWGWATWRRAWLRYDPDIKLYDQFNDSSYFLHTGVTKSEFKILRKKWDNIKYKRIDTWDYQWQFINLLEGNLVVSPTKNLISNIGFGEDATHTLDSNSERQNLKRIEFESSIVHPPCIFIDEKLNSFYKSMMVQEPRWRKLYRKIFNQTR